MARKTIGILGGMGPEATADLFMKIVRSTPARMDQDHLHVIVDCQPDIPDRTAHIEGRGPSPVPVLQAIAKNLERAGADVLVMPCNTAHYYYDEICRAVNIPMLHIAREAARAARKHFPQARVAGLLATEATVQMGLYHEALAAFGMEVLVPDAAGQAEVNSTIFGPEGIKAGKYERPARILRRQAENLFQRGAAFVILGCTELPLALKDGDVSRPVFDATQTLAEAAIRFAMADAAAWAGD